MPFKFPFTNYHELNLDWIIKKIEEITKIFEESSETITVYEDRLADAEQDAADALAASASALSTATSAASAASSAESIATAAQAAAAQAQTRAGQAETAAGAAQQTATDAFTAAQNAESIVQNFVITPSNFTIEPNIYTVTYDPNNTTVSPASIVFYSYVFIGGIKSPYTAAKLTAYAVHDGLTMPASQVDVLDASSLTFPVPAYLDKDDYIVVKAYKSPEPYVYQEVAFLTVPVIADGEVGEVESEVIAPDFNTTYDYYVGNYVWYNGKLYKFNTDHAAGAWNSSEADEVCVAWEIENNYADFTQFTDAAIPYMVDSHNNKAPVIISSASGAIASFPDGADQLPIEEIICSIEPVQAGSGDPSPDNVRPITGWTGLKLTQAGVNIFDGLWEDGTINATTGIEEENALFKRSVNKIPVINASYYPNKNGTLGVRCYAADDSYLGNIAVTAGTFVPLANTSYIRLVGANSVAAAGVSINYPSSYRNYAAPNITNIPISWQTEAGTVYGGNLTINEDGAGVLTVKYVKATIDGTTISFNGKFGPDATAVPSVVTTSYGLPTAKNVSHCIMSNYLKQWTTSVIADTNTFNAYSNLLSAHINNIVGFGTGMTYSTLTDLLDAANAYVINKPLDIIYEIETPIIYNLTAQQISTLYGYNNIFCNTGNTSVDYRADTKLFIERLTMPTEYDMIADSNIASGKFFMVGNDLYLSTAAIAAGAQITVGTNATRLSLADALNQINT